MNNFFESLAIALLSKLLPWAINRAWQRAKHPLRCMICDATTYTMDLMDASIRKYSLQEDPVDRHLCWDCADGLERITQK